MGRHLATLAAQGLKRCTLELGGHAPAVVFDDANVEQAVEVLHQAKFRNAGQVCVAPSRFFVHRSVFDEFVTQFVQLTERLQVGNGLKERVDMGPLANERQLLSIESGVADAFSRGADLRAGSARVGNVGHFYRPTVLTDVPVEATLMIDEPFGPVALVNRFDAYEEMIDRCNALSFGLAGYAFTASAAKADKISRDMRVGMAGTNMVGFGLPETPVCGINESGYGHEGGTEGMAEYQATKFLMQAAL